MVGKVSEDVDSESWEQLLGFLPHGWQEKCRELGALRRLRAFDSPAPLLRTLLIHLLDGCSLRETKVRARMGGIADVSDVALLKRLNCAGEWFRWMAVELKHRWQAQYPQSVLPLGLKVRLVDATHVSEPGNTGTDWRIHYAFDLETLRCAQLRVTDSSEGETYKNFAVDAHPLYIGDRGYYHYAGIQHVVRDSGHVLVRMSIDRRPVLNPDGSGFGVLKHLRQLKGSQCGDWPVLLDGPSGPIAGRICAVKKNKHATQQSQERLKQTYARKQKKLSKTTLEAAAYVFVFTTVPQSLLPAAIALDVYRGRWQIELVFKRLKSIIGLGHLPKQDPNGAKAWIHGKIFCAFLIETLVQAGERFFPWGYPLRMQDQPASVSVA